MVNSEDLVEGRARVVEKDFKNKREQEGKESQKDFIQMKYKG